MKSLCCAFQGCGIVVITLGAHGCYGASADESRLRRRLKNAYPSGNRPALGGQRALVPAYACKGTVNSVGAGDSFLAGIVAALCYYSTPTCDVDSPPLDLAQLLRIGTSPCVCARASVRVCVCVRARACVLWVFIGTSECWPMQQELRRAASRWTLRGIAVRRCRCCSSEWRGSNHFR